jgi:acetolactate synthase-1/2/3 large subunit
MTETAERLVRELEELGVEYVFGYPGGRVIELFEHLAASPITVVRPRDEREASVMAEAHGRLTGRPAVLAGQGPWVGSLGALGQMEAFLGSSPMVVITEASERGEYSTLAPYQQARGDYGGIDLSSMLSAYTREHWLPRSPTETVRSLHLAFKHATAGRPGPTAVVLDGDAVTEEMPEESVPPVWDADRQVRNWSARPVEGELDAAVTALAGAQRPVVVAGNGVHASGAYERLRAVAEGYGAAVVTSYLGKSTFPETHPLAAGVIGSFGHEGANQVVSEADVLLVVGSRLNPMDTNWQAPSFIRPDEQTIVHADVDSRNAGWVYPADIGLVGDAAATLSALAGRAPFDTAADTGWASERATRARESFHTPACESDDVPIKPQRAVAEIERVVDGETVVTADSGNNRFWLLNYLQTPDVRTYFGSGGVGAMGWAVPAGVAAALVTDREAIAVAGDGGFAMTMTSLETAVERGLGVTVVVLNDTSLGMVREMEGDDDIAGVEFPDSDFVQIAEGLGAVGHRARTPDELADALDTATAATNQPHVVDARIDREVEMAEELRSSFYASVGGLHE